MFNLQFKRYIFLLLAVAILPAFLILINPYSAYDLKLYYWLSQDRSPPDKIVIVALNEENIPEPSNTKSIHDWPRDTHAKLIGKLDQAGVNSIVFDVFFKKKTPVDNLFSQAIINSGKTFIVNKVEQNWLQDEGEMLARYQRIVLPLELLSQSAVLTAPSVYAANNYGLYYQYSPVLSLLDQQLPQLPILLICWQLIKDGGMSKYLQTLGNNIIGQSEQLDALTDTLFANEPAKFFSEFSKLAKSKTALFKRAVKLTPTLTKEQMDKLAGFVNVAVNPKRQVLNFLGKSTQYVTLDYAEVLRGKHKAVLSNATVFVGLSSIFKQTQVDSFLTPASFDGVGQHGIFLLVTAYDNIAHNNGIQKLKEWHVYILLLFMVFLILPIFLIRHYFYQAMAGFLCVSLCLLIGLFILNKTQIWVPLLIPASMLLILWMGAMYYNIKRTYHSKQRVSDILSRYLPQSAINKLLIAHGNKIIENRWGVCLVTDIRDFTTLSEKQAPKKVHEYLNQYYQALINSINEHQGIVSDLIGDMMMALWVDKNPNHDLKNKAIAAAFEIVYQVEKYNRENPEFPLHTGIGIHVGNISIGSLGGESHFEYRPIGDIINTTSRIESLNKIFHLPILTSAEFITDISHDDLAIRFLGNIAVSGKQMPVKLHSLEQKDKPDLLKQFSKAMNYLGEFDFKQASILFQSCVDNYADEASQLYLWLLSQGYINNKFDGLILTDWLYAYNRSRQHRLGE